MPNPVLTGSAGIENRGTSEISAVMKSLASQSPALLGGPKAIQNEPADLFTWPIVTAEDEQAVLSVLRSGKMSGWDITKEFEREFARWQGTRFALASCNGTSSLLEAMFGVGIGRGDELIMPSLTYWASGLQVYSMGATPVFADVDRQTLCIDPGDIEHRITPQTRAIMVVHYCGYPCEMDAILEIASRHHLKVIEDVSHAHGGFYKGRKLGTFGDVSAMSMMSGKSFAIGEGGMLCTNDRAIYERALAFGHYERHDELTLPALQAGAGLPWGAIKGRLNQTCAAMGRVQLKYYDQRIAVLQSAMNRFWDLAQGIPGIRPHRTPPNSNSTMGGWYNPLAHYCPEELDGLPVETFIAALQAEGVRSARGANRPLHLHSLLNQTDVYHDGKPTRLAASLREVRQPPGSLPITEQVAARTFGVPAFKQDDPDYIRRCVEAFRKVADQASKLLQANQVK